MHHIDSSRNDIATGSIIYMGYIYQHSAAEAHKTMDCFNFIRDVGETDVDCGGSFCWQRCEIGMGCLTHSDCVTNICSNTVCMPEGQLPSMYTRSLGASGAAAGISKTEDEYSDVSVSLVFFAVCVGILVLAARYIEVSLMKSRERAYLLSSIEPLLEMKKKTKDEDEDETENFFA